MVRETSIVGKDGVDDVLELDGAARVEVPTYFVSSVYPFQQAITSSFWVWEEGALLETLLEEPGPVLEGACHEAREYEVEGLREVPVILDIFDVEFCVGRNTMGDK